jgi:membrane-anchored glycerophosphoryl diester phosphodiesterase (GDPDase)
MIILNLIRFLLILIIITLLIINIPISNFFKDPMNQFGIAVIILFILIVIDEYIGFLIGLIFLIIYYRYYDSLLNNKTIKINSKENNENNIEKYTNKKSLDYISPELLFAAQNNIVDINNYNSEIKGFKTPKKVYGIQGLDTDKNNYIVIL